jgi:hypothetical protein
MSVKHLWAGERVNGVWECVSACEQERATGEHPAMLAMKGRTPCPECDAIKREITSPDTYARK